jgi:hypothetical protein
VGTSTGRAGSDNLAAAIQFAGSRDATMAGHTSEPTHFGHRDTPEYHEKLLAEGAATKFSDSTGLSSAAEAASKRKDAPLRNVAPVWTQPSHIAELSGEPKSSSCFSRGAGIQL